jgi:hypothetical protein
MKNQADFLNQALTVQGDGSGSAEQNLAGVSITGGTTASPVVCTAAGHPFADGDWVFIDGATGTTEINGVRQVVYIDVNTFSLLDEAGVAVDSAGTFGGTVDANFAFVAKPAATKHWHVQRMLVAGGDASAWVVDGMMGVSRLTNGLMVKAYRGGALTDLLAVPIKGWNDWTLAAGVDTAGIGDHTGNKFDMGVRWTFNKAGIELFLDGDEGDFLVMYSQDDLDGLTALRAGIQGYND